MNPPLPRNDGTLSYRVGQLEKAIEHLDASVLLMVNSNEQSNDLRKSKIDDS